MIRSAGERLFEAIGGLSEEIILEAEQDSLSDEMGLGAGEENLPDKMGFAAGGKNLSDKIEFAAGGENPPDKIEFAAGGESLLDETGLYQGQGGWQDEAGIRAGQEEIRISAGVENLQGSADSAEQENLRGAAHSTGWEIRQKKKQRIRKWNARIEKLGGYLKYIPIAACLCLVFIGAYYVVGGFKNTGRDGALDKFSMSSGTDAGGVAMQETTEEAEQADAAAGGAGMIADGGEGESGKESSTAAPPFHLPLRCDAYEGPVIAMTATGDTQKLKTSRRLEGVAATEHYGGITQPLLHVADVYQIKNTSDEDKTLQLVYPFVTTLNLAYDLEGKILEVEGLDNPIVAYGIGDSVSACANQNPAEVSSVEDYGQLMDEESEYQERALQKEADWNQEVSVYTFSEISVQESSAFYKNTGVIGVRVDGTDADVLTYGFDHSAKTDEGASNYCFFVPQEQEQPQLMMIVAGELESEPELGYYANLDCVEQAGGIQCTMEKQLMSYSDALRLCSAAAAKQMAHDYAQGVYAGELPEYLNADAVYQALTVISGEEGFFDTLVQRYQSTELKEIYEKLLGETRIVYAMTTVTVLAKQTLKVTAHTQKRQNNGYYYTPQAEKDDADYRFDLLSSAGSHLNIAKSTFVLTLPDEWQVTDSSLNLKRKKSIWKAALQTDSYYFVLARS